MTTSPLSAGPVMGVLSSSGSSPVFATTPGQAAMVWVCCSSIAAAAVTAKPPTGTVSLMQSIDGGSTWVKDISFIAFGPFRPGLYTVEVSDSASTLYRLDLVFLGGSAFYAACQKTVLAYPFCQFLDFIEPGDAVGAHVAATTSQLLTLFQSMTSPLSVGQIAPPLTLYKQCVGGVIAKLTVPSGALTGFDYQIIAARGQNRGIRASIVQVVSLTDANGNAVSSGTSIADSTTIYTVGATIEARDLKAGTPYASTGPFDSATYKAGIHGFTTLLEAACNTDFPVNLGAFGL